MMLKLTSFSIKFMTGFTGITLGLERDTKISQCRAGSRGVAELLVTILTAALMTIPEGTLLMRALKFTWTCNHGPYNLQTS